jgi:hypothetical protein
MARSFNGTSDLISANGSSIYSSGNFSFSVWVFPLTTSGVRNIFTTGTANPTGYSFQVRMDSTQFSFYTNSNGGSDDNLAAWVGGNTGNAWFHLGGTWDGASMKFYGNGTLQATTNPTHTNIGRQGTQNGIGVDNCDSASNIQFWDGSIADIAVWQGIVLTQTEITGLSKGTRPKDVRPGNIKAYWPLYGLQSPEPDLSGLANNGTLTGTASAFGPPYAPFTPRWPQSWFPPPPQITISYQRAQQILMTGP